MRWDDVVVIGIGLDEREMLVEDKVDFIRREMGEMGNRRERRGMCYVRCADVLLLLLLLLPRLSP